MWYDLSCETQQWRSTKLFHYQFLWLISTLSPILNSYSIQKMPKPQSSDNHIWLRRGRRHSNCPCVPQRYHQRLPVPVQSSTDEKGPKDTIIQLWWSPQITSYIFGLWTPLPYNWWCNPCLDWIEEKDLDPFSSISDYINYFETTWLFSTSYIIGVGYSRLGYSRRWVKKKLGIPYDNRSRVRSRLQSPHDETLICDSYKVTRDYFWRNGSYGWALTCYAGCHWIDSRCSPQICDWIYIRFTQPNLPASLNNVYVSSCECSQRSLDAGWEYSWEYT